MHGLRAQDCAGNAQGSAHPGYRGVRRASFGMRAYVSVRMFCVVVQSVIYVTYRDVWHGGFHFAMRRLCGYHFDR